MPRDQWARTRREQAVRRAKAPLTPAERKPTPKQLEVLRRFGYPTDITLRDAVRIIGDLKRNGWRRLGGPVCRRGPCPETPPS